MMECDAPAFDRVTETYRCLSGYDRVIVRKESVLPHEMAVTSQGNWYRALSRMYLIEPQCE